MKEFDIPTVTTTANYLHFLTFIPWLGGINVNFTFNFIRSQHSRSFHYLVAPLHTDLCSSKEELELLQP